MDYCSKCRRHLNGALVCPGCGAYAPDIAPLPGGAPAPIATAAAAPVHDEPVPYRYAEDPAEAPGTADESFDAASGRAGRRRQRERWKKTQRRALVATAVALVGGGLTVSSMSRQSTDRAQAASAPDREPMGVAEEEVDQPETPGWTPSHGQRGADGTRTPSRSSAARPDPAQASDSSASTPGTPIVAREQSATQARPAPVQQRPSHQDTPTPAPTPSTGSSQNTPAPPADSGSASKPTPAPAPSSPSPSAPSDGSSAGSGSSDATDPAGLCLLGLLCVK